MLQPRSCWMFAISLVAIYAAGKAEVVLKENDKLKHQNGGDVTVLSLEENGRFRESPLGVLSSTARTFVNGGATTEFATQILGTTVGRTYARLLSTGSRVYYDSPKPSKDPYLVFPTTIAELISPTLSEVQFQTATGISALATEGPALTQPLSINEINENAELNTSPRSFVSVRKEFSVKRNSEVKPAKVKPKADLPTVTIKNEFAPSGYSNAMDNLKKDDTKKPRAGKGLFRGGIQIKNDFQKYDTVTYVGFADFTTTVGNTVIIFMPKTAAANAGSVTSISGAATLRPEDASAPVVTTVKTFMSHSTGMATKTITGHSINMQTTLPTIQADTRYSKAFNPVFMTTEETTTESLSTETAPDMYTNVERSTEQNFPENTEQQQTTTDAEQQTTEQLPKENLLFASSEVLLPETEVMATETPALNLQPTFASTRTQVFIPGDEPLGLVKSISVIEAYDGTTTHLTSFLFGTIVNDHYTQLTQVVSSVAPPDTIQPTSTVELGAVSIMLNQEENNEEELASITTTEANTADPDNDTSEQPESNTMVRYVTKLVPTTVHQTYTYYTTFFIPTGKSIKSRELETDEVRYVTTVVPEDSGQSPTSTDTILPSPVTEMEQTTTGHDGVQSTEKESTTESLSPSVETTPELASIAEVTTDSITTEEIPPKNEDKTDEEGDEDRETRKMNSNSGTGEVNRKENGDEDAEEEIEVVIKTLYTTYTYLTTFFQETTTSIQSREVVETNIVTSTLDTAHLPEATDPAVAGLFNTVLATQTEVEPTNVVERPDTQSQIEPSSSDLIQSSVEATTNPYKTYTYYTTVFVDGESLIESRTEVVSEAVNPTASVQQQQLQTASLEDNDVVPVNEGVGQSKKKPTYGTISRPRITDIPSSEALVMPTSNAIQSSIDDAYNYDTTMSRIDRIVSTTPAIDPAVPVEDLEQAREDELKKEAMIAIGLTPADDSEFVETMVTDVTSSSSGGSVKVYDEYELDPNDQVSSESNTEEIEPSFTPAILLQTSYTTFTYFTTVYKGTSSDIISRLETVTNVVTETVKPTEIEAKLSPEEATLPITYFTTFTYWTTLYRGKSTMITSREETVSNIVTPALPNLHTESIEITGSPIEPTTTLFESSTDTLAPTEVPIIEIIPTETVNSSSPMVEPSASDAVEETESKPDSAIDGSESSTEVAIEPTTYFVTYTYFTTSYIGNDTIINSHLETETNVVTATSPVLEETTAATMAAIDRGVDNETAAVSTASLQPTGLISTIRSSVINDGITTLLNTEVYGTYIDGLYAQVLESSSEVIAPTLVSSSTAVEAQPTGVVSINEGKIIDADGVSTTLYTTKAVGTYIDSLYAQIIESTSSVLVDEARRTSVGTDMQSTTVIGSKVFTTGLVRLIEGSIVKDKTTTYYESRVIGTLIDGRYAQIIESTSSFKVQLASTQSPAISATPTSSTPEATISPTLPISATVSPAVIESSLSDDQNENGEKGDDDDEESGRSKSRLSFVSKKNTFTPVIRPFSSKRQRPTFLPKKKTGDPATTITRASFTPTVTATPASKSGGFGSSRNRFAANRKSSSSHSSNEIKPTSSSSRKFSRNRSTSSGGGGSRSFGRSTARVQPTSSSATSRRAGFRSTNYPRPNLASNTGRFRIRPTQSSSFGRLLPSASPVDDINNNDIGGPSPVTEEPESFTAGGEDEPTTTPTTTTESPRRANNPLLRFRRPPILQRPASTTTTTGKPSTTPKRSSLLRRPDARVSGPSTPRTRATAATSLNRAKPRPASSLFPPRGLNRKPTPAEEAEEKEEEEIQQNEENQDEDIQDNEYEGSETSELQSSTTAETPKSERRSKNLNIVQIRPFVRRQPRSKRQTEYGSRGYSTKYRRPVSRTTSSDYLDDYDVTPEVPKQVPTGRYSSRTRGSKQQQISSQPRVRPSPASSTPRHQFTLRENKQKQSTSNPARSSYNRRTTSSPRRRLTSEITTTAQRPKPPRLRTPTTEHPTTLSRGTSRRFSNSRRTTSRSRSRDSSEYDMYNFVQQPAFDGTITVTHKVPTEVTIPVFNGKTTEYKPVITAKASLEVLAPHQYSTVTGKDGKPVIVLASDVTSALANGLMEVTKFFVYETPTTSITFTPTVLRGRKTSFSHIVPSTVYDVRSEVTTVQPSLGNNPLANLLLSQLLLGNLGNTAGAPTAASPTTEFKTKTTTYVTTITSHTSTVLPLTFRGREITTTIVDSSTQVITATEYVTETLVITPTAVPQISNQLNTLLLPALLQAQLLNQPTVPQNPLLAPAPHNDPLHFNARSSLDEDVDQRFSKLKSINKDDDDVEVESFDEERKVRESFDEYNPENEQKATRKKTKVRIKERNQNNKAQATSVVTLYVSGKHPGEFTTLLSTVNIADSANLKKREIDAAAYSGNDVKIESSKLPHLGSSLSDIQLTYGGQSLNSLFIESSEIETETQATVANDLISKYGSLSQSDADVKSEFDGSTVSATGHFLLQGHAESAPDQRKAVKQRSVRNRRDTDLEEDQPVLLLPRRRRVRVKVPVGNSTERVGQVVNFRQDEIIHRHTDDRNVNEQGSSKRVRITRKKLKPSNDTGQDHLKRRVLVTKRRPVEVSSAILDIDDMASAPDVLQDVEQHASAAKRIKILKSKKRIVNHEEQTAGTAHRKRITVTRIRPLQSESINMDTVPDIPTMSTLYNYQYSIPSDNSLATGSAIVSEIFMSGPNVGHDPYHTIPTNVDEDQPPEDVQTVTGGDELVTESDQAKPTPANPEIYSSAPEEYAIHDNDTPGTLDRLSTGTLPNQNVQNTNLFDYTVHDYEESDYESQYDDELLETTTHEQDLDHLASPATELPDQENNSKGELVDESYHKASDTQPISLPSSITSDSSVDPTSVAPKSSGASYSPTSVPQFSTRTLTTTRLRTFTYVVTRVSGDEQLITSSLTVRPDIRTITVTESVPPATSSLFSTAEDMGRGMFLAEKPRLHLATKVMSNGVEVIVAGDKSTLPGQPAVRIKPTALRPITLAPSTLTDHMMMTLPQEAQRPHNEFVTKTYMTTYTYLTTFAEQGSTVVSSRETVVSNVITEEVKPTSTKSQEHFTLSTSPDLTTGVYHTTYTYLNTLVEGEPPLVVTSRRIVANTVTEQPSSLQPSELLLHDTNTYLSTVTYTKTMNAVGGMNIVSTEDVVTQIVITESDYLPSAVWSTAEIKPTATTTDVTNTYFATYTYYNTAVENGETLVKTEVATSSDVVTETFTILPNRATSKVTEHDPSTGTTPQSLELYATKTYLTTFTYFTTLLQDNKSPSIVVKSRTKVQQNIVTESVDSSLLDSDDLEILKSSINHNDGSSMITTATLLDGHEMEITAVAQDGVKPTYDLDLKSSFEQASPSNVIKGSTIIFFDDIDDTATTASSVQPSFSDPSNSYQLKSTQVLSSTASSLSIDHNEPTDELSEYHNIAPATSASSTASVPPIKQIFQVGNIGINSFQALGPVINAMADLFQGSFNNRKRNDSLIGKPLPVSRFQDTSTERSPVYIPVAPIDSEPSESQQTSGLNSFPETHQRTKTLLSDRPSIETSLLSGGIAISPGQVITTNSDVIIGKHSVHGPRPPIKSFGKDTVEGMKPPPLPKITWPIKDLDRYPSVLVAQRVPPPSAETSQFSLSFRDRPPEMPSIKEHFQQLNSDGLRHKTPAPVKSDSYPEVKVDHSNDNVFSSSADVLELGDHSKEHHFYQNYQKLHRSPSKYPFQVRNRLRPRPTDDLKSNDATYDLRPPPLQSSPAVAGYKPAITTQDVDPVPIPIDQNEQPSNIEYEMTSIQPSAAVEEKQSSTEPTITQQLLVNIQPSQVANVIIPHGKSTALIYNGHADNHSQKGEIFSEPSPYPDAEVGMVGVAGISTSGENNPQAALVPPDAVRMDVPVSPQGISIESLKQPASASTNHDHRVKFIQQNIVSAPHSSSNHGHLNVILGHQSGLEYMNPPSLSSFVNHHLTTERLPIDQEAEYSSHNEYQAAGFIDSNVKLFNEPANKPHQVDYIKMLNKNSDNKPFSATNYSPSHDQVHYSVLISDPVLLDSHEKQPAIIKGKPGITSFRNHSEATVTIGQTTQLKPADQPDGLHFGFLDLVSKYHQNGNKASRPAQSVNKNVIIGEEVRPVKPQDNTIYTMNMDEKPPSPTFETPPHVTTFEMPNIDSIHSAQSSAQPQRNQYDSYSTASNDVEGLTPPSQAISRYRTSTTYRPLLSSHRPVPIRKKPSSLATSPAAPPYKFEIPRPSHDPKTNRPIASEANLPIPIAVPTGMLPPPKLQLDQYLIIENRDPAEKAGPKKSATTMQSDTINPVLGGTLKVEEIAQKPEVITAHSKVALNNNVELANKVNLQTTNGYLKSKVNSHYYYQPSKANHVDLQPSEASHILISLETAFAEDNLATASSDLFELSSQQVQTWSANNNKVALNIISKSRERASSIKPTGTVQVRRTSLPVVVVEDDSELSTGSKHRTTTTMTSLGSLGNPTAAIIVAPSIYQTVVVTQTHTLTITTTESRVVQSRGQKPATHTLVVTKTHTSTVLDTVTEIHTLVKPTSILSTVTTTATATVSSTHQPAIAAVTLPTVVKHYLGPTQQTKNHLQNDGTSDANESIFVVIADSNTNKMNNYNILEDNPAITSDIETSPIELQQQPNVVLGEFLSYPSNNDKQCRPGCKASRNELCQKINGLLRCVCRPGFARMFPDHPCKPTYTYSMHVPVERLGKEKINYSSHAADTNSVGYQTLVDATKEGLHRLIMQSDLRDIYHGIAVTGFNRTAQGNNTIANFYLQLSENTDETRLVDVFKRHLTTNNFSMGGTDLHVNKQVLGYLKAEDFDECSDTKFHDCSEDAQCFNLRGTYTCSCKEGFTDTSHNSLYPGRICSAEMIGCEKCNFHGNCYSRADEELCECFQWYTGQYCQINLKVMLLILSLVGVSLIVLLIVCLLLSCMRAKPRYARKVPLRPSGFRLPRGPPQPDKRAMISVDTASEASLEHTPPPYIKQAAAVAMNVQRPKPCRKQSKAPSPPVSYHGTIEQRDRSLTVMIPRAKYRPVPPSQQPGSSHQLTMSTFGPEQKLLKYLAAETPGSRGNSRKPSSSTNHSNESTILPKKTQSTPPLRKPSTGALVSAGFEVSATVGRSKEMHECFIMEPHTDLGQPGFSTIRTADSSIIVDIPPPPTLQAELLDATKSHLLTVSEARSYDETTVEAPQKCLRSNYNKHNEDGHTMVERDIGSTFVMPHSHLFKTGRSTGSDVSNFDSL